MGAQQNRPRWSLRAAICVLSCVLVPAVSPMADVQAVTIYSYVDDQGNPVYTDAPETIPPKYRSKVKMHEQPSPKSPTLMESVQQTVHDRAQRLDFTLPSLDVGMEGLSPSQSRILTFAGAAAVVLILIMYLSKSQLVRMLSFCLLLAMGIGVPVLMYVSDGGPMDVMKQKATDAGQAQHERLQQIPR